MLTRGWYSLTLVLELTPFGRSGWYSLTLVLLYLLAGGGVMGGELDSLTRFDFLMNNSHFSELKHLNHLCEIRFSKNKIITKTRIMSYKFLCFSASLLLR